MKQKFKRQNVLYTRSKALKLPQLVDNDVTEEEEQAEQFATILRCPLRPLQVLPRVFQAPQTWFFFFFQFTHSFIASFRAVSSAPSLNVAPPIHSDDGGDDPFHLGSERKFQDLVGKSRGRLFWFTASPSRAARSSHTVVAEILRSASPLSSTWKIFKKPA